MTNPTSEPAATSTEGKIRQAIEVAEGRVTVSQYRPGGEVITTREVNRVSYRATSKGFYDGTCWVIGPVLFDVITFEHESDTRPHIRPSYSVEIHGRHQYGGPADHLPARMSRDYDLFTNVTRVVTTALPLPDDITITGETYEVACPDGVVRHDGQLATWDDAQTFIEWGHCCVRGGHEIASFPVWVHRTTPDAAKCERCYQPVTGTDSLVYTSGKWTCGACRRARDEAEQYATSSQPGWWKPAIRVTEGRTGDGREIL